MVTLAMDLQEIVVYSPTDSLAGQVSHWMGRNNGSTVRLVAAGNDRRAMKAMSDANFCVVDATDHPERAMAVVVAARELLGARNVRVYTDVNHDGLELAVREQGVLFQVGRMTDDQWDAFMPRTEDEPPWARC